MCRASMQGRATGQEHLTAALGIIKQREKRAGLDFWLLLYLAL